VFYLDNKIGRFWWQTNLADFCMTDDRFLLADYIGRRNWPTLSFVWHQLKHAELTHNFHLSKQHLILIWPHFQHLSPSVMAVNCFHQAQCLSLKHNIKTEMHWKLVLCAGPCQESLYHTAPIHLYCLDYEGEKETSGGKERKGSKRLYKTQCHACYFTA